MKLIKFGAEWCGPCRMLEPQLAKLEKDAEFTPEIVMVDIDEDSENARIYKILSIPTMVLVDDEYNEVYRTQGVKSAAKLKEELLPYVE